MSDIELRELARIWAILERVFERRYGAQFVAFENGTFKNGRSGCSIRQHHLHMLPLSEVTDIASAAGGTFVAVGELKTAQKIAREIGDYLLIKAPESPYLIRPRGDEPSQHMRQVVAALNGVNHWDWRHAREGEEMSTGWPAFEALAVELKAEFGAVAD